MWKMHAKLLKESRQKEPETDSEYSSTENLKEGWLVLMKNHSTKVLNLNIQWITKS